MKEWKVYNVAKMIEEKRKEGKQNKTKKRLPNGMKIENTEAKKQRIIRKKIFLF